MTFKMIPVSVQHLIKDNASAILTAGGVIGTVATGVLAARAGLKCTEVLDDERRRQRASLLVENGDILPELSTQDKLRVVVPLFAPAVATGTATIGAIVFANRISAQRAAALAAAYGISQNQLTEYKSKVEEKLGLQKTQKIEDELAQERVDGTSVPQNIVIIEGEDVLCFDEPTGRYFKSTMEKIRQVVNQCNQEILHHDFVSAEHFYSELNLPTTTWANEVGFNVDNLVELSFSTTQAENGKPCIAIDFKRPPTLNYMRRGWGD